MKWLKTCQFTNSCIVVHILLITFIFHFIIIFVSDKTGVTGGQGQFLNTDYLAKFLSNLVETFRVIFVKLRNL